MSECDYKSLMQQANALLQKGKFSAAIKICEKISQHHPEDADALLMTCIAYVNIGQLDLGVICAEKFVELRPESIQTHVLLGNHYKATGQPGKAVSSYRRAVDVQPNNTKLLLSLGALLVQTGVPGEASLIYKRAIQASPAAIEPLICLGNVYLDLGKPDKSEDCCRKALILGPENIDAVSLQIRILERTGEFSQAWEYTMKILADNLEHVGLISTFSSLSRLLEREQEAIDLIERLLDSGKKLNTGEQRHLHFILGKLYDSTKSYDKAFMHFSRGNRFKQSEFNSDSQDSDIENLINFFTRERLAVLPRATYVSDKPIFIVGMPRSGSTLVEQILSSHPDVHTAGEQPHLVRLMARLQKTIGAGCQYPEWVALLNVGIVDECARHYTAYLDEVAPGTRRVTDKTLNNFIHLGLIQCLFPHARIIHCMRDPIDTCLSVYFQDFSHGHLWTYNLENIAKVYTGYQKIMHHWRGVLDMSMLDVQYEDVVNDLETSIRRITEFCGLQWDKRCMEYYRSARFVNTASYQQVRQPIYKKSIGRGKNYQAYIKLLTDALCESG